MSFLNALFPSFSNSFNIPFLSVVRTKEYSSAFVKFGDSSPTSHRGNLILWTSVRSVVTTPLPYGVLAAKRLITFWREDGRGSVRPHKKRGVLSSQNSSCKVAAQRLSNVGCDRLQKKQSPLS